VEKAAYSILLLGPSNTRFSETTPDEAMPFLLERELRRQRPGTDWRCLAQPLFFGPSMRSRAEVLIERHRPDLVLLVLASPAFSSYAVVYQLQQRWPRLFRPALKASQMPKRAAGGGAEGASSPRGLLFRVPRRIASSLVGIAPIVTLDQAIESTKAVLDALVRNEDVSVIYRLTVPVPYYSDQVADDTSRVAVFNKAIGDYCCLRHVTFYDLGRCLADAGRRYEFWEDRLHPTLRTRLFEAEVASRAIIRELKVGE
jgi:hypothetical protein